MSDFQKLSAEPRTATGSAACRRLRRGGLVPGVIYGHKEDPVAIQMQDADVHAMLAAGAKVMDVDVAGKAEKAMLRDIQWDTFGTEVWHCDFVRVSADERMDLELEIELAGIAPGVTDGGVMEQQHYTLYIECPADKIPDKIIVDVSKMQIGQALHVSDLELDPEIKILVAEDTPICHIVDPEALEAAQAAELEAAEPEEAARVEEEQAPEVLEQEAEEGPPVDTPEEGEREK